MTTDVFCRIEPDRKRFLTFLDGNDYPPGWSEDMLTDVMIVRVFDDRDATVCYVWGHWVGRGSMAFHVCVGRAYRGALWATPDILRQLYQIAFWMGADEILTSLDGVKNARRLRPLLLRLGFVEEPGLDQDSLFTLNLWEQLHNGKSLRQQEVH